jgi:hypothetical protein
MGEVGDNLARLISAWTGMLRSGQSAELAGLLDEGVVWQGMLPELICHGREEALDVMVRNRRRPPRITRIEAEEFGDRVVVSVEGPDFPEGTEAPEGPLLPPGAPRSLVFTFQNGRVVRMESFPTREAAFALAGG